MTRLGEAIEALALRAKLCTPAVATPINSFDVTISNTGSISTWVDYVAQKLGIEAEPVSTTYAEVVAFLQSAAPALVRLPSQGAGERYLALWQAKRQRVAVIAPDLSTHWIRLEAVRAALCQDLEAPLVTALDSLLAESQIPEKELPSVRATLLGEQLGGRRLEGGWLLRLKPGVTVGRQIGAYSILPPLCVVIVSTLLQQVLFVGTWAILGRVALTGQFEWVWLWALALLLLTTVLLQALERYNESLVATRLGILFKERLLQGMLQLDPEEIRHESAGHFLGRVLDADAVEVLSVSSGFFMLFAGVQILVCIGLFASLGGSWLHTLALALFILLLGLGAWITWHAQRTWFEAYRQMTNDVAERMVGHRTRLAQEDRALWHVEEDQILDRHLRLSSQLDSLQTWLASLPRAWMVIGLGITGYIWLFQSLSPLQVAILFGTTLLAFRALDALIAYFPTTFNILNAWVQVRPLFQAAVRSDPAPLLTLETAQPAANDLSSELPLIMAKEISYRYRPQARLVLDSDTLSIYAGNRLLLEGPSGGGKSTLSSMLAGLRIPESGLLLLHGYDRNSLGAASWRRHVVMAPQFHENHVFTGTFAFNLLLGRDWPPREEDVAQAIELCRELGLGDLLDRMPSGIQQIVGESGWQLSHGERSRLYIARALLQNADLLVLDESFAALDPENLALALRCVLQRAPALLVIAHP